MKGTRSTKNEVRAEFAARKKMVDEEAENEREEKRAERAGRGPRKVTRGEGVEDEAALAEAIEREKFME